MAPETMRDLIVGLDVGSITVKAAVVDVATQKPVWQDYQRHETEQQAKVLEFLKRMESEAGIAPGRTRLFITGSGSPGVAPFIGAKFVHEVNAISLAVERHHPNARSVIELGGQDAKIIVIREIEENGRKKKIPSMNDKCAGGTGMVIDKISAKLGIPSERLCEMRHTELKLHPVAGKCGVFAEIDINGLQKSGMPENELMASLFEAIVQQNLSVLTRGHTLQPEVLLLGGPNSYIKGMVECWRENIPCQWAERGVEVPDGVPIEELIRVPDNALYFAALGAVYFGMDEDPDVGVYHGFAALDAHLNGGRDEAKADMGVCGLVKEGEDISAFVRQYSPPPFEAPAFGAGERVDAYLGVDGGSTSTKAVLLSPDAELLAASYQLSKGNPIKDTIEVVAALREEIEKHGATLRIRGAGTTGYAKDILREILAADVGIAETIAHTQSALYYYDDVDVICDVGGQDIKIIMLHDGKVKDFKLNTQCSAGNGYFLQSTAERFGFKVTDYADLAFTAERMPEFGYGCAVFMQSDIVDFQRKGWTPAEIMAGLTNVLPKNIWLYIAQIPNVAKLGKKFILQGGTQRNAAAVKAQVDFLKERCKNDGVDIDIIVHQFCGESGAIGAALEARRVVQTRGTETPFIGLDAVNNIRFASKRDESTRCYFCKNKCLRTFIDYQTAAPEPPKEPDTKRLIIATCEKGEVEDINAMREIKKGLDKLKDANPNLVALAATEAWKSTSPTVIADPVPAVALTKAKSRRVGLMRNRKSLRFGMPRVLNMYSYAPFLRTYLESLGVDFRNIVFSNFTSPELYKEGSRRGSIDPCFPSKLGIAHIHNLLAKHVKKPLDYILFPMINTLTTELVGTYARQAACTTVVATPETARAAFVKENDIFAERKLPYLTPLLNFSEPRLLEKQMYEAFNPILGLSWKENCRAVEAGYRALDHFNEVLRRTARKVLDELEREERPGIVFLGRPYQNDPGVCHEIPDEFQKLGYPILSQDSLPIDEDILERLFGDEVRQGVISHPLDISDCWKNSYSENTNRKVWAAKFVARHPNLVAIELSNFKCGHDAPVYSVIEEIVENSGTPYFSFKDIDENKPTGSIKLRVETIHYFLQRYHEEFVRQNRAKHRVEDRMKAYRAYLEETLQREGALPAELVAKVSAGRSVEARA
jgi:predicted CoA-substrate-specific enzyme activase